MGVFKGTSGDITRIINELRSKYGGGDYNLLSRNCNNFADDFLIKLLGKELPGYVNRMATIGSFFSCLLPNDMTQNAPVNNGSISNNPIHSKSAAPVNSFSGSGVKLGGYCSSTELQFKCL